MTDERFDTLTRRLATGTSRRGLLKGMAAIALGGVAARVRGTGDAEARARVKMACARLGQPCNIISGTPGNKICCPHLACDTDLTCCKPQNASCVDDGDCCADSVCRPNPSGLGNRCLPPGLVGAACVEDADCAGNLVCDIYSATCLEITGEPCTDNNQCVSGVCDDYTGLCAPGCLPDGNACGEDADCCSGFCDPYTSTCVTLALCVLDGGLCSVDGDCCSNSCDPYTFTCNASAICVPIFSACPAGCSVGVACAACCGADLCFSGTNCSIGGLGTPDPCC